MIISKNICRHTRLRRLRKQVRREYESSNLAATPLPRKAKASDNLQVQYVEVSFLFTTTTENSESISWQPVTITKSPYVR